MFRWVSFRWNNEKGIRDQYCDSIRIENIYGLYTDVVLFSTGRGFKTDWIHGYNRIKFGNIEISYAKNRTCPATWCFEDFKMSLETINKLVNHLKQYSDWDFEEAPDEFTKLWKKDTRIQLNELEAILNED